MASSGRPQWLSAEQATQIALAWAAGAKYADACQSVGLTKAQARQLKEDADWMAAYDRARAEFVTRSLQNIDAHGQRDWKATAWLLERILPERFGKRDTVQHEVRAQPLPWRSLLNNQVIEVKAEVVTGPDLVSSGPPPNQGSPNDQAQEERQEGNPGPGGHVQLAGDGSDPKP